MLATLQQFNDAPSSDVGDLRLIDRLEAARRVIEVKFLGAGEVLSEAVDGIGALIAALDDLTGALDPAAIAATAQDLTDAAAKLTALPVNHDARRRAVSDLDRHRVELARSLSDMRQSLAYMRAFTMNIKITAGGIAQADTEFGVFAQEMASRIESGRTEVDGLQRELDALQKPIAGVFRHGETMAARCAELIPLVPDQLLASATLIGDHHGRIAAAAAAAAEVARAIRKKVGRILSALQIGDITRQRIEHVQAGLALIDEIGGDLSAGQYAEASALVQLLQAIQLGEALQDFDREVSQIVTSMSGLGTDAQALMKLRDLAYGQGAEANTGVLRSLEGRLDAAQGLVREIEAAETEVLRTGQHTAEAAEILANRLAAIQAMKSDVVYMALNTMLKSCRIGEAGRPLATIAVELRTHAGYLEQIAGKSLVTLNHLIAAAGQMTGDGANGSESDGSDLPGQAANETLGVAARRIGAASDRTETDIRRLAERGEAVLTLLNRSTGRFGFQDEIGQALAGAAAELSDFAKDAQPCGADLRDRLAAGLGRLYAGYTMVQEREAHQAFLEAWDIGAGAAPMPEPQPAPSSPDSLDDMLF